MIEFIKNILLPLLRVPAEPMPPAGDPESIRVFRASRGLYYLNLIRWALGQSVALAVVLVVFVIGFSANLGAGTLPFRIAESITLVVFLAQLPFSFLIIRLEYEMRWYVVTDRSLRIRYGMIFVREMTMTFANIQQITIHQGPIQRLLGIADLQVRTAGGGAEGGHHGAGGGLGESMHIGYFRGVDNAAEIRDLMLERLRRWRDTGLGDPEELQLQEHAALSEASTRETLAAAQAVLTEARTLRNVVS